MFGSIVVGTDGSDTAQEAVKQAIELARIAGAALEVVSAYEPVPRSGCVTRRPRRRRTCSGRSVRARTSTRRSARSPSRRGKPASRPVPHLRATGRSADAILDVAEEQGSGLIVVGNKGMTGAKRFLLGSVPNKVSHHAPCSVLIIRTT